MKTVIVGAGIIGLTSAWYLVQEGHDVMIVDQFETPAQGASFANGGMLSVGHSAPNMKPGIIGVALKSLFQKDSFLNFVPDFTLHQARWLLQSLREATAKKYTLNQMRMIALAKLSRAALSEIELATNIHYEKRSGGIMQLCQNSAQMEVAKQQQSVLHGFNINSELLTLDEVVAHEPGLIHSQKPIVGGIRLMDENTGSCEVFARALASKLETLGVKFQYGTTVTGIVTEGQKSVALTTNEGDIKGDHFVFATGADTYSLLKSWVKVPVYPVKGYSLTVPVIDESKAPQYSVFDTVQNVAITRFDHTVRIAGYGGIEGFDRSLKSRQIQPIIDNFQQWFPDAADLTALNPWAGFRPMTPDGTPIISRTAYNNVYLNTGHGTFGWTMSCGSGKLLAELMTGKSLSLPEVDYSLTRY